MIFSAEVAPPFLQKLPPSLARKSQLRANDSAFAQRSSVQYAPLLRASDADWATEFLDLFPAVGLLDSAASVIHPIERFGSHRSDCIIRSQPANGRTISSRSRFCDSLLECSTRFTDGRVWFWGRDKNQHRQTACPRTIGNRGINKLQTH